ncbi:gas vesicle protein GvpG [Streptomyces litmocidini]|uniref:Gas vesicle protein GvpG n=1 Tax=Streptomyces litmocidini TaxID=67318 RepID=A0ABW7U2W6_9ACTN
MGLLGKLVTLPLAPVRTVVWAAQRVTEQAEAEYYNPAPVLARLAELERRLLAGEIDEETFDREEDLLLDRLEEIDRYRRGDPWPDDPDPSPTPGSTTPTPGSTTPTPGSTTPTPDSTDPNT